MSISGISGVNTLDYPFLGASVEIRREYTETLTVQFQIGILQERVARKHIDPHTLIHKAILENNSPVIEFLLRQGVDVDYPDENGMTPLTIAILNRCNQAVDTLLQHGGNVNPSVKWNNMTLVELAINMKDIRNARLLSSSGSVTSAYSLQKVLQFIRSKNDEWYSFAVEILERGINLNVDDQKNNTAENNVVGILVELVLNYGMYDLIKLTIKNGANINDPKLGDRAPLMKAIRANRLDDVKHFVELGADVNYGKNGTGTPMPLRNALFYNYPEIVQYLLQRGAIA